MEVISDSCGSGPTRNGSGSQFSILVGMGCSSLFLLLRLLSLLFFLLCPCHPNSLRSLRFCFCSPVCALSLSLFVLHGPHSISFTVLLSQSRVLLSSVYCTERMGSSTFSVYTPSPIPCSPTFPTPFWIAELLHTVHTCLVRCNLCIS